MTPGNERTKKWRKAHPEKVKAYTAKANRRAVEKRNATPESREAWNTYHRAMGKRDRAQRRDEIITLLGGKCVTCGYSDKRALQIDHINGGGSKAMKQRISEYSYTKAILISVRNGEGKFQLLCANCNWIKRHETNENEKWRNLTP